MARACGAFKAINVCFVAEKFYPVVGGAEVAVENQAGELAARGHTVTVITPRHNRAWPARDLRNGIAVLRVGGLWRRHGGLRTGRLGMVLLLPGLLAALWRTRERYNVIHVAQFSPLAAGCVVAARLWNKAVVIGTQSAGPDEALLNRVKQGELRLLADTLPESAAAAEFLVCDSKRVRAECDDIAYLRETYVGGRWLERIIRHSDAWFQALSARCAANLARAGYRSDHIVRIANSVDTDRFRPSALVDEPTAHLSEDTRPERVICVARLEFSKGIDVLLHAWARLLSGAFDEAPTTTHSATHMSRGVQMTLRLALAGDGSLRQQLEQLADALGIRDSVEFLGTRSDVTRLVQSADVFVLPSRWEGMANALLEAMASGVPCIATRVSGSEDLIQHGINGLLVEPEHPAQLASALALLLGDRELAARMGAKRVRQCSLPINSPVSSISTCRSTPNSSAVPGRWP